MHFSVFRETVTLAHLAGITAPIRPVVPFDKGGVDGCADHRLCQRRHYPQHGAAQSITLMPPSITQSPKICTKPKSRIRPIPSSDGGSQ
jgi:hypothetical protein